MVLICVYVFEFIEDLKNDLFAEILRDEAVARLYELGKVYSSLNMNLHAFI